MAVTYYDFKDSIGSSQYAVIKNDSSARKEIVLAFDSIQEVEFTADTQVTTYPTEYNIEMTDYKYKNPNIITVRGISEKSNKALIEKTKEQLEQLVNVICRLDIQTKSGLYNDYSLVGYKIPENYDNFSYFEVIMTFQENLVNPYMRQIVANASDSDTVFGGISTKSELSI